MIVTGTRFIYPADAREKTIRLTNQDDYPNVVQAWVDINNPQSTPTDADAPFVITPPMFRMEPKAGQTMRMLYTGQGLPQDRESVFYLNVLQIPPRNSAYDDQSQMLVMTRSRLKVFYRPGGIQQKPESVAKSLRFRLKQQGGGWVIDVENPTGYFASFAEGKLAAGTTETLVQADMVPPLSHASWPVPKEFSIPAGALTMRFLLVNDYGARVPNETEVAR
ncbi:molecular chaperone [Pseudomonas sp. PDNC002]|nr:molecular chaperone [Pseudomonas sp. PDNC002]